MNEADQGKAPPRCASREAALAAMVTAEGWVAIAKSTRSSQLVDCAQRDLQAAVDDARDLGVQWGLIGSTLGIARGNAYQRYRKRLSTNDFDGDTPHQAIA